ncbi:mandelate racemase/muconate lactonizing enzyme family protein [Anoxynatronum sibiricum]|uniref:Mandelate racemase/muconate lactonizing enzyme family protein n=1 Tax=Anoxynatronum sibiricum TaxID=210623 RepID=A0ABU9W0W7_9CLOT
MMKIRDVQTIFLAKHLYVRVTTDNGLEGIGECGTWGFLEASAGAVEVFREYLIGKDPLKIEYHWQYLYQSFCFRGAAIVGALGAIDIALWDIAGKYYGVPVYRLLGGGDRCRDKLRAYCHVKSPSIEEHIRLIQEAKKKGFTAVGHLNPYLDPPKGEVAPVKPYAKRVSEAIEHVRQFREVAGNDMDLCLEIHRRLDMAEAVALARGVEEFHPFFFEDPLMPDNIDTMGILAGKIPIAIATGERFISIQDFAMLFVRNGAQFARVSVCAIGGLTPSKKIASMAEAFGIRVVPHNPGNLSPISTAACVQFAASIQNFAIQEIPADDGEGLKAEMVQTDVRVENGYVMIPDSPGIGASLRNGVADHPKYAYAVRKAKATVLDDGSCGNR